MKKKFSQNYRYELVMNLRRRTLFKVLNMFQPGPLKKYYKRTKKLKYKKRSQVAAMNLKRGNLFNRRLKIIDMFQSIPKKNYVGK